MWFDGYGRLAVQTTSSDSVGGLDLYQRGSLWRAFMLSLSSLCFICCIRGAPESVIEFCTTLASGYDEDDIVGLSKLPALFPPEVQGF